MDDEMITKLRNKCVPSTHIQRDLLCFKDKGQELKAIIADVVLNRGSNSVLISGPRNSGKTTLVESVISELSSSPEFETSCHVIRLSGILCHDVMSSLEELSYQLKIGDEYASFIETQSFVEGRTEILTFLKEAIVASSRAIIIILDQIELFCEHPGQALLYNLFDIARSEEKSVCIIGMTPCQEILELFEKRVKSRFSHRIIYLKPLKFEEYQHFALALVQLELCKDWNNHMKRLLSENSVVKVLRQLHHSDNSIGALCKFWFDICLHCESDSDLTPDLITELYSSTIQGYGVRDQCLDLNLTELLIVLGILKAINSGSRTFTFNILYDIIQKAAETREISETDIRNAMRKLMDLGIITPADKTCSYYRVEMDIQDLDDVSKNYTIPAEFRGLL